MEQTTLKPNKTQCQRVLDALIEANGEWVSGRYFLHTLYLSQFHARILELQAKGYDIEASDFKDGFGYKSYRLVNEVKQTPLFEVKLSRLEAYK